MSAANIRPFVESDVGEVAALWQRVFRRSDAPPPESLLGYFREVLFRNPWMGDDLPSLVSTDRAGRVVGFLGVMPREMTFRGRPVRVAVSTQLMVDPDGASGLTAVQLLQQFFAGPQDLAYTDGANDVSTRLWQGIGGEVATLFSLDWTRVLRPTRYVSELLAGRKALRPLLWAATPFGWAADAALGRVPFGPYHTPASEARGEVATTESILACWWALPRKPALCPVYEPESLDWLIRMTASKKVHGELRRVLVRDESGQAIGWYLYYLKPGGTCRLVQLAASEDAAGAVLDHLFHDARRHGASAVTGRMDPAHAQALSDHHCRFKLLCRGVLVHSRNVELVHAVQKGDAFLSCLEGEWWMRFGGDQFE